MLGTHVTARSLKKDSKVQADHMDSSVADNFKLMLIVMRSASPDADERRYSRSW